eukprot:768491-Hanusia_phi.AAC.4
MRCNPVALVLLTACLVGTEGQYLYRGGSIQWFPNPPGSHSVEIVVHTVWTQPSGGGVLQAEDAVPFREHSTSPPRLVVSNGMLDQDLVVKVINVSSNSQVTSLQCSSFCSCRCCFQYAETVEGVSVAHVNLTSRSRGYVAEVQGCCRDSQPPNCYQNGAKGLSQHCGTSFLLRTLIKLDALPPPFSYLPFFFPYNLSSDASNGLPLPIVDFRLTHAGIQKVSLPGPLWPTKLQERLQNKPPPSAPVLLNSVKVLHRIRALYAENQNLTLDHLEHDGFTAEESKQVMEVYDTNSDSYIEGNEIRVQEALTEFDVVPPLPWMLQEQNYETIVKLHPIGSAVPMLDPKEMLILYESDNCSSPNSASLPPGADLCQDSFVEFSQCPDGSRRCYPNSSLPVIGNFKSLQIPTGLVVDVVFSCEVSQSNFSSYQQLTSPDNAFSEGSVVQTCDSRINSCCSLRYPSKSLTFRTRNVTAGSNIEGNCNGCNFFNEDVSTMLQFSQSMSYVTGINQLLPDGNYPVLMQVQSDTSAYTFIEFIWHKMSLSKFSVEFYSQINHEPAPCTLETNLALFATMTYNNESLLNLQDSPTVGQNQFSWTPCFQYVGFHFFCVFWGDSNSGEWSNLNCDFIRVVENLPPKIIVNISNTTSKYSLQATAYMGQRVPIVLALLDNYKDRFKYSGISQVILAAKGIFMNNGESAFATTTYRATATRYWSRYLQEFVNATPPKILDIEWRPIRNISVDETRFELSAFQDYYVKPNYMNSGLNVTICFMVINGMGTEGQCTMYGPWTEQCIRIDVVKCRYSIPPGRSLVYIAGLFKTNWIQIYSLNPLFVKADAPIVNKSVVVDIGKLYKVTEGEDIFKIARQMGINIQQVMFLNAELTQARLAQWTTTLHPGQTICLIPNSCNSQV